MEWNILPGPQARSLASYLLLLVACLGGFMLRTVVWFCARTGTEGKGANGTLTLKKRLPNVPCLYFIIFRRIRKVSSARSKWCPCCCCLCLDILGAETFSALPMLVLIAPLWEVPLIVALGTLKEDGTSHVTRADTRHQEEWCLTVQEAKAKYYPDLRTACRCDLNVLTGACWRNCTRPEWC